MKKTVKKIAIALLFTMLVQLNPNNYQIVQAKTKEKYQNNNKNSLNKVTDYSLIALGENGIEISGSESVIEENTLSNGKFKFFGSRLILKSKCITNKKVEASGSEIKIESKLENASRININSLEEKINKKVGKSYLEYKKDTKIEKDNKSKSIICEAKLDIVGDKFLGDKYIISNKGISIKSNTFNCVNDNGCVVYSKNGDIEITSSNVSMKGLIYAPNGTVNITSSNFQIEGKIIAKNIIYRGSRFNIKRFNKINSLVDLDEKLKINDSDNDGCSDYLENKYKLNLNKKDTDEDGLSDGFEMLNLFNLTDASNKDTDKDGVNDSKEDTDKDNLINEKEEKLNTNGLKEDTDNDGLKDGEEVNKHKTNPLKKDTDEDKLIDGEEIKLGTDPLKKDTDNDGVLDGDEKFNQKIEDKKTGTKVVITSKGDVSKNINITKIDKKSMISSVGCKVSTAVDIQLDKKFEKAKVKLPIDVKKVPNKDIKNVKIFYLDEEKMTMVPLKNQGVNEKDNTVWGETTHFTTFVLFYVPNWKTIWKTPLNKGNRESQNNNSKNIDIMFTIDSSGSMSSNDPEEYRIESAKRFVDALIKNDRAGVVDFDDSAKVITSLTTDLKKVKEGISRIDDSGGTSIGEGADAANHELINNGRKDAIKIQILLTDGNGGYNSRTISEAKENKITIYTIGLGSSVNSSKLKEMAESTGGMYFPVKESKDLPKVFSRISNETVKVKDIDDDGVPDNVEVEGIRDGLGNVYKTDKNNPDTDGDGRTDGQEVGDILSNDFGEYYMCSSNPTLRDSDGDSLSDIEEEELGTKPYEVDSDYDGITDAKEIDMGYDPLNVNPDGDSFGDFEELKNNSDPFFYDKTGFDYAGDFAKGFFIGDGGEWFANDSVNSLAYITGHIISGVFALGDIRDLVFTISDFDLVGSIFNIVSLIPVYGDAAKISSELSGFIARNTDNIPNVVAYITKELDPNSDVYKLVSSQVMTSLLKNPDEFKKLSKVENETLITLAKRSNDLKVMESLVNKGLLKISDEAFTVSQKKIIDKRISDYWGKGISKKLKAEAAATEGAILKYENEGYKLIYAQRKLLKNGQHGPDVIMKKGDDVLIVEAKGSYCKKAEISDGNKRGRRLTAVLKKDKVKENYLYLSREWLSVNARKRYLNKYKELNELSKEHKMDYGEAYKIMDNVINKKAKYKASVVYGGVNNSKISWGRYMDDYCNEITNSKNAKSLELIKFDY